MMQAPKIIYFKKIPANNGDLYVIKDSDLTKFSIKRVFTVVANKNSIRGKHAHKKCIQILNCPIGKIKIECIDKHKKKKFFLLNNPKVGLIVYPMTWCVQKYLLKRSLLVCLCNKKYSENDYIRSFKNFLNY